MSACIPGALVILNGDPCCDSQPGALTLSQAFEEWDFTMWNEREDGWFESLANGGTVVDGSVPSDGLHLGVITMTLATTASSRATYRRNITSISMTGGRYEARFLFQIATAIPDDATPGDNYTAYLGTGDSNTLPFTDGVGFILDNSLGSTNWFVRTEGGGANTDTDTGTAPDLLWHDFRIIVNADATSVQFLMDGVVVATNTTNIPTASELSGLILVVEREAALGTQALEFDLDYVSQLKEFDPPRP